MSGRPVNGVPGLVAHLKPCHARPDRPAVMIRRLAFPRGRVPPHLVPYVEALKATKAKLRKEV